MDSIKDTQNSLELAKFVENQSVKTNPFGENRVGERAYRRAERIAAALVLLTNHISEHEPLRVNARTQAAQLPSRVLAVRDEMRAVNSENVRALRSAVRELISLCRLLGVSGLVSFQNASAVSEALDELSGFLAASQRSTLSESSSFSREDFLDTRDPYALPASRHDRKPSDIVRDTSDVIKDTKGHARIAQKEDRAGDEGQKASLHVGRMAAILEVLRVSGALGIRDIASNLPEYSEKMVQRELSQMIAAGRIKKTGSKRWSIYAVA